ncbi:rhodanese-like domain-containing protein [Desulfobacterota bacterium M19]
MKSLLFCLIINFSLVSLCAARPLNSALPTSVSESKCARVLTRARQLYRKADYKQEAAVLRQAITKFGGRACDSLWRNYRQSLLAQAGDDYLTAVPRDRYRIPAAVFGGDYKKAGISKYFLLDVRQPEEFIKSHIAGSLNIPFRQVLRHLNWLPKPGRDKVLLIICRSQHRANYVLVVLRELGYSNAYTLQGGYRAYQKWLEKGEHAGPGSAPATPPKSDDEEEDFSC